MMGNRAHWTFTSSVITPNGLHVTTTVELPPERATERAIADAAELTQMATSTCAKRIEQTFEEILLEEVPF